MMDHGVFLCTSGSVGTYAQVAANRVRGSVFLKCEYCRSPLTEEEVAQRKCGHCYAPVTEGKPWWMA